MVREREVTVADLNYLIDSVLFAAYLQTERRSSLCMIPEKPLRLQTSPLGPVLRMRSSMRQHSGAKQVAHREKAEARKQDRGSDMYGSELM